MAVNCSDPGALADAARCFARCIPDGEQLAVQTYLLAVLSNSVAGTSLDPTTLANAARCFTRCIPGGILPEVQAYLLCQIANASGA